MFTCHTSPHLSWRSRLLILRIRSNTPRQSPNRGSFLEWVLVLHLLLKLLLVCLRIRLICVVYGSCLLAVGGSRIIGFLFLLRHRWRNLSWLNYFTRMIYWTLLFALCYNRPLFYPIYSFHWVVLDLLRWSWSSTNRWRVVWLLVVFALLLPQRSKLSQLFQLMLVSL